jgi:hypothetical protein
MALMTEGSIRAADFVAVALPISTYEVYSNASTYVFPMQQGLEAAAAWPFCAYLLAANTRATRGSCAQAKAAPIGPLNQCYSFKCIV